MNPQRKLALTPHAESRSLARGITLGQILHIVRNGKRKSEGERVLHYDDKARICVVVNWRDMVIVTVKRLNDKQRRRLMEFA